MSTLQEKIKMSQDRGFSNDEIYEKIKSGSEYQPMFQKSYDQGFTDEDIYEKFFGEKPKPKIPSEVLPVMPEQQIEAQISHGAFDRINDPNTPWYERLALLESVGDSGSAMAPVMHPEAQKVAAKGVASGATLGLSEYLPGMGLEEAKQKYPEFVALHEGMGNVAPMEVLLNAYGKAGKFLLNKSPTAQKYLTGLTNLVASGLSGATMEGLEQAIQGENISTEDIAKHGATWAALDGFLQTVGWGKNFARKLLQRSQETGKPSWQVLNQLIERAEKAGVEVDNVEKLATQAFSDLEKDLEKGTSKIQAEVKIPPEPEIVPTKDVGKRPKAQESTEDLTQRKIQREEPVFRDQPDKFIADNVKEDIEEFAPRYRDKKQFGENVQADIEGSRELNENLWTEGYAESKPAFQQVLYKAEEPANLVLKNLNEIDRFKTRGRGYNQAKNDLVNTLEDMGYTVEKSQGGGIENIMHTREYMTADEAVQLSRRISELGEYEDLERNIKKKFNQLSKVLKEDAKQAVRNYDSKAYDAFEKAEREFERFEEKLSRDSIRKMRKLENTEQIAEIIQKPTALKDLKDLLTKDQFHEVERELLEHFNNLERPKAEAFFREIQGYMSSEGKKLAKDIVNQKQFNEFVEKLYSKDGFNFSGAEKAMQNTSVRKMIRDIGGDEAVRFFQDMGKYQKQMQADLNKSIHEASITERIKADKEAIKSQRERGAEKLRRSKEKREALKREKDKKQQKLQEPIKKVGEDFQPSKKGVSAKPRPSERGDLILNKAAKSRHPYRTYIEEISKDLGTTDKTIIGLVLYKALGMTKKVGALGSKVMYKLAQKPSVRKKFMQMVKSARKDPKKFIEAAKTFSNAVED